MAANQHVVDELVVKLTLDTKDYDQQEKKVDGKVEKTRKSLLSLGKAGALLGLAVSAVAGFTAAVVTLVNFEARMRRMAVATGLSNRAMQAWGSTARRLGADAESGRQAIADLAKEQKTFSLTGSAPTLSALARLGVRAGPGVSVEAMLAQAQQIYRSSGGAQREQIEAGLSAQGVSDDLILMIKSEKDVRETYAKSYKQSADENRKALDDATDSMETLSNGAIKATAEGLDVASSAASGLAKVLDKTSDALTTFAHNVRNFFGGAGTPAPASQRMSGGANSAQGAMQYLITRHGLSVDQAAGVVANLQRESGLNPGAFNPAGGGQGARGIAQWRGDRQRALLASGATTVEQQLDFMMSDPAERARMRSAFGQGGNLGTSVSRVYEAHGDLNEDLRRGRLANQMASDYRSSGAPTVGQQINVQNMTVQANNPEQLGGALQRQSGVQNYSAGQR